MAKLKKLLEDVFSDTEQVNKYEVVRDLDKKNNSHILPD